MVNSVINRKKKKFRFVLYARKIREKAHIK